MVIFRKYNTATASGTHLRVPIPKAGSTDFATGSDWTPATGDVKLSKDGGSQANIGTLPSYTNGAWEFQLTGGELTCKQLEIMIVDSATKAIVDQSILIETFGNASAMYQADLSAAALAADVTKWNGTAVATPDTAGYPKVTLKSGTGTGEVSLSSGAVILQATQTGVTIPTVTNVTNTAGAIRSNTCQSGSTSTTAKLDASASATDDLYNGALIVLTGGTGAGQCNGIIDYVGSTKVATLARAWAVTPDNTSTFSLLPQGLAALFGFASGDLNEAAMPKASLYAAQQKLVGKNDTVVVPGQSLTYRNDGSTEHFRQALTTDAGADGITVVGGAA
jgi:hypothetical protein